MSRTEKQEPEAKADMQFLPDSPEHIEESMKRLGALRNQLYEACRKAIVRVNKS